MAKLWLIEGIPGSGKTTFAEALQRQIPSAHFYSEIDAEHPVDVHDVHWVMDAPNESTLMRLDQGRLVRSNETNGKGIDVYELPFDQHVSIMLERWRRFVEDVRTTDEVYLFECALLQNPFTIGMVSQDVSVEKIASYVKQVVQIIEPLSPTVCYFEIEDVVTVFERVYLERSRSWQTGFLEYYTSRRYATSRQLSGIHGVMEILKERQRQELALLEQLPIVLLRCLNDGRQSLTMLDTVSRKGEMTCNS